jgi:hypothetical protein
MINVKVNHKKKMELPTEKLELRNNFRENGGKKGSVCAKKKKS